MTTHYPFSPIPCALGDVLPVSGGRVFFRINPLPENATDDQVREFNRYHALLCDLGHRVVVGDQGALALALAQELAP